MFESALVNISDTIQTLTYVFRPVIENYRPGGDCNNGIAVYSPLTIAPEIKYNLYIQSRDRYYGSDIRCHSESNGSVVIKNLIGGFYNKVPNPYFYNWNTGSSLDSAWNLKANIKYKITVYDKLGCLRKDSITLSQPDTLIINPDPPFVKSNNCQGVKDGSIDITPIGGTPGYRYHWSNGIDPDWYTQDIDSLYGGMP